MSEPSYTHYMRVNHEACPRCGMWHSSMSCAPQFQVQSQIIASLRAENERLRGALRRLYDPAKIASVQIVCMGGDELCDPCINRERLCEALAEVNTILEGGEE